LKKEVREMKHKHDFESVYHPNPSSEVKDHGILAVEIRKCKGCHKEIPFVLIKNRWLPLFEDEGSGDQEILLA
jgi:hypothetical protein